MAITAHFLNLSFALPSPHHQEGVILLMHSLLQQAVLHAGDLRGYVVSISYWL